MTDRLIQNNYLLSEGHQGIKESVLVFLLRKVMKLPWLGQIRKVLLVSEEQTYFSVFQLIVLVSLPASVNCIALSHYFWPQQASVVSKKKALKYKCTLPVQRHTAGGRS